MPACSLKAVRGLEGKLSDAGRAACKKLRDAVDTSASGRRVEYPLMSLSNVLTCSVESCFLVGRRKYTVGARAAIVASVAVAKRSSGELNLSSDISSFDVCVVLV